MSPLESSIPSRSRKMYRNHRILGDEKTNRLFVRLLLLEWVAAILVAWLVSPYAWEGCHWSVHLHLKLALILGAALSLYPFFLVRQKASDKRNRMVIACSQMVFSILFIHLSGGRIETHFHIFGSLAFLAFYRDWRVLVPATVITAVDHVVRGMFFPQSIFGVSSASNWRWFEHVCWVLFEVTFLVIWCERSRRELMEISAAQAEMEVTTERIERQVEERTKELVIARDEALQAAQAKSTFLATMSHEIRTPMNGVIGMTGLLLDTDLTDEQRDYAQTISTCGDGLLTVINDILDFSKLEAEKVHLESIEFDLRATIEDVADLLAFKAHEKGLEFPFLINQNLPSHVKADPGRFRQVLLNLISNSIKFTAQGEVSVHAGLSSEGPAPYRTLYFEIHDTGVGIPLDKQAALFAPFTQADASVTREFGGTGLGLAISKKLVEAMGGEIGFRSTPGVGSVFHFTILVEQVDGSSVRSLPLGDIRGSRVLIIDDNHTNRRVFREQLTAWGCLVEEASSAEAGIAKMEQRADSEMFDIALVDFQMPGVDGASFARDLKSRPKLQSVRLILVTSLPQQGDAKALKEGGFDGYLTKPIKQRALYQTLAVLKGLAQESTSSARLITVDVLRETPVKRAKILVAEDNRVNQKLILKLLEKEGYTCDLAVNGREAVEAARKLSYDLILMDCQMPVLDGFSASQQILAENPDAPPIVALTAGVTSEERLRCQESGMRDFVAKPIKIEPLRECLARHLSAESSSSVLIFEHHTLLNSQRLDDVADGDPLIKQQLLRQFLKELEAESQALLNSLAKHATPAARQAAHTLKTKALYLGAIRIAKLCEAMERHCEHADLAGAEANLAEFEVTVKALQERLVGELSDTESEKPER